MSCPASSIRAGFRTTSITGLVERTPATSQTRYRAPIFSAVSLSPWVSSKFPKDSAPVPFTSTPIFFPASRYEMS